MARFFVRQGELLTLFLRRNLYIQVVVLFSFNAALACLSFGLVVTQYRDSLFIYIWLNLVPYERAPGIGLINHSFRKWLQISGLVQQRGPVGGYNMCMHFEQAHVRSCWNVRSWIELEVEVDYCFVAYREQKYVRYGTNHFSHSNVTTYPPSPPPTSPGGKAAEPDSFALFNVCNCFTHLLFATCVLRHSTSVHSKAAWIRLKRVLPGIM